jgi:hypothetical protein
MILIDFLLAAKLMVFLLVSFLMICSKTSQKSNLRKDGPKQPESKDFSIKSKTNIAQFQ